MKSKKKIIRIIDIAFWLYIIGQIIFEITKVITQDSENFNLEQIENLSTTELFLGFVSLFFMLVFLFIFFLIVVLIKNFHLTIFYFGYKIAYRKHNKEKFSKIDFKNDHYYRDIIQNYSPATLSYIDNFSLEEKDVIATLISLERKNKIIIKDEIELIDDNTINLSANETYILENIKNNNLNHINMLIFESKVIQDCLKSNLLDEKKEKKKQLKLKILSHIFIYIGIIITFYLLLPYVYNNFFVENEIIALIFMPLPFILFFIMIIYPFVVFTYIKSYRAMDIVNPYVRSKSGEEINLKLEGLKNYIKDFSVLKERDKKEIPLWEDYLIYSVLFGINTKITKNLLEIINKGKD